MPPPVALAVPGAVKAALVASQPYVETASSATLAYVLAWALWQRVPAWIREDVAVRHLLPSKPNDKDNILSEVEREARELTSLASVLEKLQALLVSGSEKLGQQQNGQIPHLHAAVLAYVQLAAQLRYLYPKDRQAWYCNHGAPSCSSSSDEEEEEEEIQNNNNMPLLPPPPPPEEIAVLKQHLDYAVWAYEMETE